MSFVEKPKRSIWTWGYQQDEPTNSERQKHATELSKKIGIEIIPPKIPLAHELNLRTSRIKIPDNLSSYCFTDNYERSLHSYGAERELAALGKFPNPPDVVAHPSNEDELAEILDWCDRYNYVTIPYGGGSSVVGGVTPPEDKGPIVTIDMDQFDQVLEIDEISRTAKIQAGIYGPELERQLKPSGHTLRHYPQSFVESTLGGWIATRSGGHYATNHTHIDEFVESLKMITPSGWWESRRLPGSGAGPNPDRIIIGSEGILGIITEAWMRIQKRPQYRATAAVMFNSWENGYDAVRQIAQAKLWPSNLRILDPDLTADSTGIDNGMSLLIIGFESSDLSQKRVLDQAIEIAKLCNGIITNDNIIIDDGTGAPTGRGGAVGAWRNAFINVGGGLTAGLGMVTGTFETAITWDKWPGFDKKVREATQTALDDVCGGGTLNCRFTHVYPDGPAPYYTYVGNYKKDGYFEQQDAIKKAASDAIISAGGTITHHHAVGRLHKPWYDVERPELFAESLKAMKKVCDPSGILNPGVLIDPA